MAIALWSLLAATAFTSWASIELLEALVVILGGLLVALVGWYDDHRFVSARKRIVVHMIAAAAAVWVVGYPRELDLGVVALPLGPTAPLVATVGVIWLINLYNFMDGTDGLAGSQALIVGVAACAILGLGGAPAWYGGLAGIVTLASAGFLMWNWPPAKIFMGDTGSGFLGYIFGVLVLSGGAAGIPSISLVIPLGVFVVDATFTLMQRLARGEPVYHAHRTHTYQLLVVRGGWSHLKVCLGLWLLGGALGILAVLSRNGGLVLTACWLSGLILVVGSGVLLHRFVIK